MKIRLSHILILLTQALLLVFLYGAGISVENENVKEDSIDPQVSYSNKDEYGGQKNLQEKQMSGKLLDNKTELFFKEPADSPGRTSIKVHKSLRILDLFADEKQVGRFKIALGGTPEGQKNKEGDSKTPEGRYYICTRNSNSRFYKFLGLSYPNTEDAGRGLRQGLIDSRTFESIKAAQSMKIQPRWDTPLGGAVGIHGGGNDFDWTLGCIALTNEDVDILWKYSPLKTDVEIYE